MQLFNGFYRSFLQIQPSNLKLQQQFSLENTDDLFLLLSLNLLTGIATNLPFCSTLFYFCQIYYFKKMIKSTSWSMQTNINRVYPEQSKRQWTFGITKSIEMEISTVLHSQMGLMDLQQVQLGSQQAVQGNSYIFIQNKMFNYFMLAPCNAYSLSSLSTDTANQTDPPRAAQVAQEEYSKLLQRYDMLKIKYERVKQENNELKQYVNELEDVFQPEAKKKKIKRRTQSQLSKEHSCLYPSCKKEYASPLALNLHIRNKHNGGTKKERIAFVKLLLQAQEKGLQKPQTSLQLCPQLLQLQIKSYRQKVHVEKIEEKANVNKQSISSQFGSEE